MFKKLFEPGKIGGLEVRNRIIMPAIHLGYAEKNGAVTQKIIDFYVERAKGGVGLIIVGGCYVDVLGMGLDNMLGLHEDRLIEGYVELVETVKKHGAKIGAQLFHAGRYAYSRVIGAQPVAPSRIPSRMTGETPRELTIEEIKDLEEKYGEAALRAKKAGFDMVEILASTGYLVSEFLSPVTNKRTDMYGGPLENRMRFLLEIVETVRKRVGSDFPISCRVSIDELMEGGNTVEEGKKIVQALENAGVNVINSYAGWHESPRPLITMHVSRGEFVYLAEEVKKVVKIPVIAAIRINNPFLAEEIIASGKADFVCMGRPLIADPELPKKALEGKVEDIRPCIACNQGCLDRVFTGLSVECCVNAAAGREAEAKIEPVSKPKKVVVVGGGPGGMEAARVAALRGHKVILYEKNSRLGGQLNLASKPPGREEIQNIINYLSTQLNKLGVEVKLGVEADVKLIEDLKPDVVIVASGVIPIIPEVEGIEKPNVFLAHDVLAEKVKVGDKVVVVGGGGVGCGVAEFLAQKGKNVTIVEMLEKLARDVGITTRWIVLLRLRQKNVKIVTKAKLKKIVENGVIVAKNGEEEFFEADSVVIAVGSKPNNQLAQQLKGKIPELYTVGDCVEPRKALEAIHEGFDVAIRI